MKCQYCSRAIKFWQPACPACQKPLKPNSYSTIAEATQTLEQKSRRRLLQQVLQYTLLAVAFIALASIIRIDPPKANPLPQENLRAASSTPTPEIMEGNDVPVALSEDNEVDHLHETRATSRTRMAPISLLSATELGLANSKPAPLAVPHPIVTAPKRPRETASSADEMTPRKMTSIPSTAAPVSVAPRIPSATEAAPKLEVEPTGVILHPNTGLVTINSYVPARVYIDGVYSGNTPRSVKLLAGEHSISLLANGYHEYSRKIKVLGQQQVGILAAMSKK
ncbi:MAG TPA: PEGA domain-containing protein [Blastocatellia bacterium]|nr:PEGA domain-containing protein [Blastocatellia bacterium]